MAPTSSQFTGASSTISTLERWGSAAGGWGGGATAISAREAGTENQKVEPAPCWLE